MPGTASAADTIKILVSTDNHVGYAERDAIRGEDSWRSFHEVMCLARERDVDMVLLAGDLFHDNKPSRKSMFNVMRSLRMNCLGDKPCELEMLSDNSEVFQGAFDYVNYEDPDINVAIPVFSIHGNHDDPSGEGHLAALDILQTAGLVNYYGRTPESDNIQIKPVLLQKGRTKLALYGMSNVRDERLFRTFRDGKVKFFRPGADKEDWFNLMSVHQNRHAYTETGYLPESFLPDFIDLVVWGHEHECLIDPEYNAETNFRVMQPGSSVATSLVPGEAGAKHVALLSVTDREFRMEKIQLKSVRPFVMKEIVLAQEKGAIKLAKKPNNQTDLTRFLEGIVNHMIKQANQDWEEAQGDAERDEDDKPPLPLIRLRVEYTAPEGGNFQCENPQRFSNRFVGKVANVTDVVQFHRRKSAAKKNNTNGVEVPTTSAVISHQDDAVKVEKLVREFLSAQSLTIFPQNSFGDAVSQYVDKDDKHAMESFVIDSLKKQVDQLLDLDAQDEEGLQDAMERAKAKMEALFAQGHMTDYRAARRRPKPDGWDSDLEGHWNDQAAAIVRPAAGQSDDEGDGSEVEQPRAAANNARRRRGGAAAAINTGTGRRGAAASSKAAAAKPAARSRRKAAAEDDDDDEDDDDFEQSTRSVNDSRDTVMLDDSENDGLFVTANTRSQAAEKSQPARTATASSKRGALRGTVSTRKPAAAAAATTANNMKQSQLTFSQQPTPSGTATLQKKSGSNSSGGKTNGTHTVHAVEEISDDDDDDAFEPAPSRSTRTRR